MYAGVRVVAVDLDGTLLRDDGTVSPRTVEAIGNCQQRGITVLPVTARSPAETIPLAVPAGVTGEAICCLGAVLCHLASADVAGTWPLPRATACELIARVRRIVPTVAFGWVDPDGEGREPAYPRRPIVTAGLRVGRAEHTLADTVWHLFARDAGTGPLPAGRIRAATAALAHVTGYGEAPRLIDFTAVGVSKGTALRRWCASRGVNRQQVAAVGDSDADLPMLTWAAASATMANASAHVRSSTGHVVPGNNDDGAAFFLERLRP